jgi:hypothetical protein
MWITISFPRSSRDDPVFYAYNLTEDALLKRFLFSASALDDIASKPAEKTLWHLSA